MLSIWHLIVIFLIFVILFGTKKISSTMEDLAKGIKIFKKTMNETENSVSDTMENIPGSNNKNNENINNNKDNIKP